MSNNCKSEASTPLVHGGAHSKTDFTQELQPRSPLKEAKHSAAEVAACQASGTGNHGSDYSETNDLLDRQSQAASSRVPRKATEQAPSHAAHTETQMLTVLCESMASSMSFRSASANLDQESNTRGHTPHPTNANSCCGRHVPAETSTDDEQLQQQPAANEHGHDAQTSGLIEGRALEWMEQYLRRNPPPRPVINPKSCSLNDIVHVASRGDKLGEVLAYILEPEYLQACLDLAASNFATWAATTFSPAVTCADTFRLFCDTWTRHATTARQDSVAIVKFLVSFGKEAGWPQLSELPPSTSKEVATNYAHLLDALHQVSEQLCLRKGAEGQPDVWAKDTCRYLLYVLKQGQTDHPEMRHMLLYLITVIDSVKDLPQVLVATGRDGKAAVERVAGQVAGEEKTQHTAQARVPALEAVSSVDSCEDSSEGAFVESTGCGENGNACVEPPEAGRGIIEPPEYEEVMTENT